MNSRLNVWLTSAILGIALLSCSPKGTSATPAGGSKSTATQLSTPVGTLATDEPLTALPVEDDDATWGENKALVTVVAFLDFECRFCAQGFDTLLQLQKKYSASQLRIVVKHLPLEAHKSAVPAAIVGQVVQDHAGSKGFFQFAKLAFDGQAEISFETLADWAHKAGVDVDTYNQSVSDPVVLQRIIQDVNLARRIGIEATPTFFVNGKLIDGAQEPAYFEQVIDAELVHMRGSAGDWAKRYQRRVSEHMSVSLVKTLLEQDPYDYRVPIDGSPIRGLDTAPVTMVVFSDYECPFCKRGDATVDQVIAQYGDKIRVAFKQLPLPFHESARPAALLASAVQLKSGDSAFFNLSHELFAKSPELGRSTLNELGLRYGLSQKEITATLDGHNVAAVERLTKDSYLAEDVLATGTPHFFINGKRLSGARPIEHFSALIEHELERAEELIKQGIPAADVYDQLQKDARAPGAPKRIEQVLPVEGRPSKGPAAAPVVIHLFSDFECPYCRLFEQNLASLHELFPDQLRIVWHDFPLPFHEQALPLARAAHAAYRISGNTGFWNVHGAIFALDKESPRLTDDDLHEEVKRLNLDWTKVHDAMKTASADAEILSDQELAQSLGIRGTPACVIGDYLLTGAKPLEHLSRVVQMVLDEKAHR